MTKKIMMILVAFCLAFGMNVSAFAEETYVRDNAAILTEEERASLEERAKEASEETKSGIYILTVEDFSQDGYSDTFDFAIDYYTQNDLGYGEEKNGVLVMLSMNDRDYEIICYGENEDLIFNAYGFDEVVDAMLDDFAEDYWYNGFFDYIATCRKVLNEDVPSYYEGDNVYHETNGYYNGGYNNYDDYYYVEKGRSAETVAVMAVAIIGVPSLIAGIICFVFYKQMKSVYKGADADNYVPKGGFTLTAKTDRFSHTTVVRNKIKTENKNGISRGGGGFGGGSSHRSGGFSGRSGKF